MCGSLLIYNHLFFVKIPEHDSVLVGLNGLNFCILNKVNSQLMIMKCDTQLIKSYIYVSELDEVYKHALKREEGCLENQRYHSKIYIYLI